MNYTTLTAAKTTAGSIKRHVNYSAIDADVVLEEAQALVYSLLRVREMRSSATLAMSAGDSSKALPTGYLDPIGRLRDTDNARYRHVTPDRLEELRVYDSAGDLESGQPGYWSVYDELVQFDFAFDEARTLRMLYYKSPSLLSGSNETNFLTSRYPHLLRAATSVRAHAFMKNWSSYSTELELLTSLIGTVNGMDDLSYRGADYDAMSEG